MIPLALASVLASISVSGETSCPSARQVASRLVELLPQDDVDGVLQIAAEGGAVRAVLRRRSGEIVGSRRFEATSACGDLADLVAVAVAAWQSDVHAEFPDTRAPATRRPAARPAGTARATATPARPRRIEIEAGLFTHLAPAAPRPSGALGASVGAGWVPAAGGLGARLGVRAEREHHLPLGAGAVRWQRVSAALGPCFGVALGPTRWRLEGQALLVGALLRVRGAGFPEGGRRTRAFDPGVVGGVRLSRRAAPVSPWLELGIEAWGKRHEVLQSTDLTRTLPRVGGALSLGASFGGS